MICLRPPCPWSDVPGFIQKLYGLGVSVEKELVSYCDRNILVKIDDPVRSPHYQDGDRDQRRRRLLVKIINEENSAMLDHYELKNALIIHLNKAGFPTPAPLPNLQGNHLCTIELLNEDTKKTGKHLLSLLEFVEGTTLDRVTLTKSLCWQVGKLGGWLDQILKEYPAQDNESINRLGNEWNLLRVPDLRSKLQYVTDKDKLPLIEEVISSFETKVLSCQNLFSKGFIHGDLNECNILVSDEVSGNDHHKRPSEIQSESLVEDDHHHSVSGFIDFGDCCYSLHIFEAAIAMCYAMMNKNDLDPMEAAGSVLSGYLQHVPLSSLELTNLHISICARLVMSFVYSQEARAADETNEYSQLHGNRTWPRLIELWKFSEQDFLQVILESK